MGIEDKIICLCLNKLWQPIGVKSVREAFNELVSPHCSALNIIYKQKADGSFDFNEVQEIQTLKWEDWIQLPIRQCDLEIRTSKLAIRVPTIIVSSRYSDVPIKRFRPTKNNIWLRDKGICQYSGKKLKAIKEIFPLQPRYQILAKGTFEGICRRYLLRFYFFVYSFYIIYATTFAFYIKIY